MTVAVIGTTQVVWADHGYWPVSGVDPAGVAGHASRSALTETAEYWGADCTTVPNGADDAGLDTYGHVLVANYGVAVVLAAINGIPLEGPNGVTIFLNPRAGEFLWADADGDGVFKNQHEADASALFLCARPSMPATDADPRGMDAPKRGVGLEHALLAALALAAALALVGSRARSSRDLERH